jgi:hypothetical protein
MVESVYVTVLLAALKPAGSAERLAAVLGVPVETLTSWLSGNGIPTRTEIQRALDFIADPSSPRYAPPRP